MKPGKAEIMSMPTHHHLVGLAAEEAGDGASDRADEQTDGDRAEADAKSRRMAAMMREKISSPKVPVPKRWAADGGLSTSLRSSAVGS